ncbi:MAG TPA: hypothetical protein VM009_06775 [Terriglobales bacterium]|nr:hypothetical protein [Terriglobales bacterium]
MRIPLPHPDYEWQPVSNPVLYGWLAFYVLYLIHATRVVDFTLVYPAELVMHEAGHLLFSFMGQTIMLWGGTIFQLMVPLMLAASFAWRGHTTGVVFSIFFFFESMLGIAVYIADAREQDLPLVSAGGGDGGEVMHDWWNILTQLDLLQYDTRIAGVVRAIGWIGMLATLGWLFYMSRKLQAEAAMTAQAGR